jgi:ribosomal protein L11 methyltransferase
MANILAAPLIDLAPLLTGLLRPGGQLALSGILEDQAEDVRTAYRPCIGAMSVAQKEEWILLAGQAPESSEGPGGTSR